MKMTPARARWIGRLGATLIKAIGSTWRIRMHGHTLDTSRRDNLAAFLHGDMLIPAFMHRRTPAAIMVSQHGDGEVMAQVIHRLGCNDPVRGSSTRGGARAFLEMVQKKGELNWAITPDGPRGPRRTVHDGVILLASEGGRAIMPHGFAVSRGRRLRSWDRFLIPSPFARIAGFIAEPLRVPPDLPRESRREYAEELQARMQRAEEEAQDALVSW